MIWQNPWAWAGVITVALPILIHLLGRDRAPRHTFPTLRFLEVAELLPTRRMRVHDALLLAVRVGALVAAAAGLAQPLFLLGGRARALDQRLARAIVVDTSASMLRTSTSGGRALDAARREAQRLASEARTNVLLETATPSAAMAGAIAWLETQPSRREVVVVSDFQRGMLEQADLASVPAAVGVRAVRIEESVDSAPIEMRVAGRDADVVARTELRGDQTSVVWRNAPRADGGRVDSLAPVVIAAAEARASVDATLAAATSIGVALPLDTSAQVAIVDQGANDRAAIAGAARPLRSLRLIELAARIRADSMLAAVSLEYSPQHAVDSALIKSGFVIARGVDGRPIVVATQDIAAGRERLLLFAEADPGSLVSAALIVATRRALSVAAPIAEQDPTMIAKDVTDSWQRAPADVRAATNTDAENGPSDGRWFWLIALALLAIETWMRRSRDAVRAQPVPDRTNERAA